MARLQAEGLTERSGAQEKFILCCDAAQTLNPSEKSFLIRLWSEINVSVNLLEQNGFDLTGAQCRMFCRRVAEEKMKAREFGKWFEIFDLKPAAGTWTLLLPRMSLLTM